MNDGLKVLRQSDEITDVANARLLPDCQYYARLGGLVRLGCQLREVAARRSHVACSRAESFVVLALDATA